MRRGLLIAGRWVARAAAGAVLVIAAVRVAGIERASPLVPLIAFTPQVLLAALFVGVVALVLRTRGAAALALVAAMALAACIVPRAVAGGPHPDGPTLRVMTVNILNGLANKEQVTEIVQRERVDVLVVQELTYRARLTFLANGLEQVLPYRTLAVRPEADGTGIYSRFPLEPLAPFRGATGHIQVRARVEVPGTAPVTVAAVHAESPDLGRNGNWRATLREQPTAREGRSELLVGDFNGTLDHAEMRRLLGRGWADAADRTGDGLIGTWPADASPFPTVALDHVLVSEEVGVRHTDVFAVHNSDHRVVLAVVELP